MDTENKTPTNKNGITRRDQRLIEALTQASHILLDAMKAEGTFDSEELSALTSKIECISKRSEHYVSTQYQKADRLGNEVFEALLEYLGLNVNDITPDVEDRLPMQTVLNAWDDMPYIIDNLMKKKRTKLYGMPDSTSEAHDLEIDLWMLKALKEGFEAGIFQFE